MTSMCKRYCSVPQCSTYKSPDVSIHLFPNDPKLLKKWKDVLKIGKPITKGMSVCSKHFLETDFTITTSDTKRRRLKKGVIPSQNIPTSSFQNLKVKINRAHRKWLKPIEQKESLIDVCSHEDIVLAAENTNDDTVNETYSQIINPIRLNVPSSSSYVQYKDLMTHAKFMANKSTQTYYNNFHFDLLLDSDKKWNALTGADSAVVKAIEEAIVNILKYNEKPTPEDLRIRIILTLMKLKLNIPLACLAIMFSISLTTCSRYFESTLELMALALKPLIYWPSKDEIIANMPKCFEKYRSTRVVLDCTEISVQKCRCLTRRLKTWSNYKGTHTYKFLVGITPSGLISFISRAYGGRASDKAIFVKENLISKCDGNDSIMVDRGFAIERECEENCMKLIRPPFFKKSQKQFSKKEAEMTADIARARVHVERSIQRIKIFAIVTSKIAWNIVPYIDDIMTVICGLVNLSAPILADDKFKEVYQCHEEAQQNEQCGETFAVCEDEEEKTKHEL